MCLYSSVYPQLHYYVLFNCFVVQNLFVKPFQSVNCSKEDPSFKIPCMWEGECEGVGSGPLLRIQSGACSSLHLPKVLLQISAGHWYRIMQTDALSNLTITWLKPRFVATLRQWKQCTYPVWKVKSGTTRFYPPHIAHLLWFYSSWLYSVSWLTA